MYRKTKTLLVLLFCGLQLHSQSINLSLKKYFGSPGNDYGQFVTNTNDGNFLVIGMVQAGGGDITGYHAGNDIWTAKVSPAGAIIWQRTLGGNDDDVAISFAYNKTDGSVIIAANTISTNGDITVSRGGGDVWLAKLSSAGALLWQKTLGGSGRDAALNIINTTDGNYLLSAETNSTNNDVTGNHGDYDIWLVKLNSAGTVLWKRCYGGTLSDNGSMGDAFGSSLAESPANNYIFSANTSSVNGDVIGYAGGVTDAWVVKTDVSGNIVWQKTVGGSNAELVRKLRITPGGKIVVLAQTASPELAGYHAGAAAGNSYDVLQTILLSNGTVYKQRCFGSPYNESAFDLAVINDSTFVFAAKAQKNGGDITDCATQDDAYRDIWLCKTKDTTILWSKCYGGTKDEQQAEWIAGTVSNGDLAILKGNSILYTGISKSNDGKVLRSHPYGSYPDYDIWMLTLDSLGNIQTQNTIGEGADEWIGGVGTADTATNSYAFIGSTQSYNNNVPSQARINDMFLLRFDGADFIKGQVYFDNNLNNTRDAGEPLVTNAMINVAKPGVLQTAITQNGFYQVQVDTGSYIINCVAPRPYFTMVPPSASSVFNTYFRTDVKDFALQPIPNKRDIGVTVVPLKEVRLDSVITYNITYFNRGSDTVSAGTVELIKDARSGFTQALPDTSSATGDTLRWNYTNLKPFETRTINLTLKAGNTPVLTAADTIRHFARIFPLTGDLYPADNSDTLYQPVVTSLVSTGKLCNFAQYVYQQYIIDSGYITYTIRFQNTGTTTVTDAVVTDSLDASVDSTSVQVVAASHNYEAMMSSANKITWNFRNIQLPGTPNDPANRAYIVFRVRLKTTVTPGTVIKNKANVSFDGGTPVTTNEVSVEVHN